MKIPVDVTFHPDWWHKNAGVSFNRDFFDTIDIRLEADVRMRRVLFERFGEFGLGEEKPEPRPILGSDLIASGFLHSEILGCEVRYSDGNPPEVICMNLEDEGVAKLEPPDLEKSEVWGRVQLQIDRLLKDFGHVEPCINLMGIQNLALDIRGQELFIDYHMNPGLAHHLLEICTKLSTDIGTRLRKLSPEVSAGVTAIVKQAAPEVYLTSNCTVDMVSPEIYEKFLLKYDNLLSEHFKPFAIHHCGRSMEKYICGYEKVNNLAFAEVGAFSDIGTVRRHLPEVFLNARYSPVKLKDVGRMELEKDIREIVSAAHPEKLLSVSCVGIDSSIPNSQIINFFKSCQNI